MTETIVKGFCIVLVGLGLFMIADQAGVPDEFAFGVVRSSRFIPSYVTTMHHGSGQSSYVTTDFHPAQRCVSVSGQLEARGCYTEAADLPVWEGDQVQIKYGHGRITGGVFIKSVRKKPVEQAGEWR